MTLAQRLITFFINLSWLNAVKILTASHPKSSLPFSGVIMKHELSSMKAFVILAESSSFNNAAKLLNITQPALTRRIKDGGRFTHSTI
ncbi:hypothetical protein DMH20_01200 [Escherichia coli]|nr:hypothetical protein [Escherichia coli]